MADHFWPSLAIGIMFALIVAFLATIDELEHARAVQIIEAGSTP